jgi:hypothetical protein
MATLTSILSEDTKVNFKGKTFLLKLDANEDPKKKGIKVQFVPVGFDVMSDDQKDDLAISLESKLEPGLKKAGLRVERDRELKDPRVIGFFIYIEYIERIVLNALKAAQ